ncbi:hypothetical protein CSB45_07575 [candidate division KSB3 bacterium]|uniref:Uncharacterized protein n=1 Tax=candidate division KSB3 bacterium TaxID=2044937 RepID=A0A2G6E5L2_9BACT|nr:MAG: hypothetical protein CSB45_07575 [candidate division KSB3 bacterium]PIE29895.1 MAG: hypothetical protein CSA57_06280 [candidate division KSB3 bacterium]
MWYRTSNNGQPVRADRGWYLITEFEHSPSIHFPRAVELSQTHPGFTRLIDERNIMIYRNIYRKEQLRLLPEMLRCIKEWKGAKLYVNGERVAFDMLGRGIDCYCQTVLSRHHSQEDCQRFSKQRGSGFLACRRSHVSMTWSHRPAEAILTWFSFGQLDEHHVYRIDKEQMESAVMGELVEYHHCPLIDLDQVRAFIRELPDRIDPRKNREWRYADRGSVQEAALQAASVAAHCPAVLPVSEDEYRTYLKLL